MKALPEQPRVVVLLLSVFTRVFLCNCILLSDFDVSFALLAACFLAFWALLAATVCFARVEIYRFSYVGARRLRGVSLRSISNNAKWNTMEG